MSKAQQTGAAGRGAHNTQQAKGRQRNNKGDKGAEQEQEHGGSPHQQHSTSIIHHEASCRHRDTHQEDAATGEGRGRWKEERT